jgi:hypothetical protein
MMMAEMVENATVCSFLPSIKSYKILKACIIPFGLRNGNSELFVDQSSELYLVFG